MSKVHQGGDTSLFICPECQESISPGDNEIYDHFIAADHGRFMEVKLPNESEASAYVYRRTSDGHYECPCKKEFATDSDIQHHIAGFLKTCTDPDSEHDLKLFPEEPGWAMMSRNRTRAGWGG
jgi:hypothetical protein